MGFRHYSVHRGEFITADPIEYGGGWNLYTYTGGDPVNRIDPDGLKDQPWYKRTLTTVNNVVSAPFKLGARIALNLTRPTMRPDAPSFQKAYIDPDEPEYGLRVRRAGNAISGYIEDTTAGAFQSMALGSVGKFGRTPRQGWLTNGTYVVNEVGMAPHLMGTLAHGKSQFLFNVDARTVALRAAEYADSNSLWVGNKARVFFSDYIGVHARTGLRTRWVNVYRTRTGNIHASPASP